LCFLPCYLVDLAGVDRHLSFSSLSPSTPVTGHDITLL
jgi:hypothetical protein